ncbi:MAG: GMC family oxidoreductase [Candidatus Marinimicrobia bacterium]|nr:GMC family oxidoreductase [Candidatus Neomarinimicrobiota bacterium]
MKLTCDIAIIGSGAAGGVLASTLAEKTDKKILLLEKGGYYESSTFVQEELGARHLFSGLGTRGTKDGSMAVRGGECVGGGTTVNVALCFDPVQSVWDRWKRQYGINNYSFDANSNDYGITGLNMPKALQHVRERINIHQPADEKVNDNNRLFANGCKAEGVTYKKFELNMKDCIGCGFCTLGCAYDRKMGTMITYIQDAIRNGVQVIHNCHIEKINFSRKNGSRTAIGVKGKIVSAHPKSLPNIYPEGSISISAKLIIVASGAVESPSLLIRSHHPDPNDAIGRGLILHPSLPIIGLQNKTLVNYRGITGSMYSDHFYESHGFYFECLFGHPIYSSGVIPGFGNSHFEIMMKYQEISAFGVMLIDTPIKQNKVLWNFHSKKTEIFYRLTKSDKARLRFAATKGVEIMFGSGASEVMLPSEEPIGPLSRPHFRSRQEAQYCNNLKFTPHQTVITSAHCQATVSMGEDHENGILNSRCESKTVRNLMVCDSSSFPDSCGANPMVSIMVMARYQGTRVANELARYDM